MKVKKVDIKTELLDVPENQPYLKVAIRPQITAFLKEGEYIPDQVSFKEKTYLFRKVKNQITKDIDIYAVEVNEDKLFTDLVEITQGFVEEEVERALDKERKYCAFELLPKTKWEERQRIKKLSWYKRLFNKF